jgi:hypothetical protein
MGSGSVDKVEENLDESTAICDDTIYSLIGLHIWLCELKVFPMTLSCLLRISLFLKVQTNEKALQVLDSSSKISNLSQFSSQGSLMNDMVQVEVIRAKYSFI